jgi:hypothetical protein
MAAPAHKPQRGVALRCQPGEIGWILEDNQGMVAIADAIDSHINKAYRIYSKAL